MSVDIPEPCKSVIERIRQLYKIREEGLLPVPWCEDFSFSLNEIFTRLRIVGKGKTRGEMKDEITNMTAIFKTHEECKEPPDCFDRRGPRYGKNNLLSEAGVRLGNFTRTLGRVLPEDCSTSTAKVSRYQIDLTFGKQLMSSFFLTTSTKNVKKTFSNSFVSVSPRFCSFLIA